MSVPRQVSISTDYWLQPPSICRLNAALAISWGLAHAFSPLELLLDVELDMDSREAAAR